ncbi:DUF3570 domain-containing protein [Fibrella sp. WM1]|uniref:DUF3570 domain-containing protein n=1 Tax=Fibrella musci TaxID=3242485 RepID=UPI0035211BEA
MKKVVLTVATLLALTTGWAQVKRDTTRSGGPIYYENSIGPANGAAPRRATPATKTTPTTAPYESRGLKLEEINFVSSYYHQDGNNSAITGGIGTEKLTDVANSFDLTLSAVDRKGRQHYLNIDANIDYYTSASSDNIDPVFSGASRSDVHIYPSVSWRVFNPTTRVTKGFSYAYSTEYDYRSHGFTAQFAKLSADRNREVSVRASAFLDTYDAILPAELRPSYYGSGSHSDRTRVDSKPRQTFNLALSVSQVINKRLQVLGTFEPSFQQGLLSTPFHRVYFTDGTVTTERLPGTRLKFPVSIRANYFQGDHAILRTFYRFYVDDWGMVAHTANVEVPIKLTAFLSISPFYRFHTQTAVNYFRPYGQHDPKLLYHTSDYDIGNISTQFVGTGIRMAPPGGVLGIRPWQSLELRYGHYLRSTGLTANIVTLLVKVK